MDIVFLQKKYGNKISFKGGIDKHILRRDKKKIAAELEYKLQPIMRQAGILALDHRITNGTSLDNYTFYVSTAREILGLPSIEKAEKGWNRMAF
jgi:uroporphyrinogen-III decarboxylase